jgi:CubicO group peptidase (beta-lactamase class C family)
MNMQTFLKNILTGLLVTGTYFSASAQIAAEDIKAMLDKEVYQKRSPGIIVGTIDATGKRQLVAAGSFKDKEEVLPDEKTMYEIGSITKVFTSLLLADMVIKKQVNLEDPVSKYLPATVKLPVVKGKEITLLNLANHSVGWPRMPDNNDGKSLDNPWADYTIEQTYDYINRAEIGDYAPGTWFKYSNVGYGLLGHILSQVAGKPYETLVKERICTPLNMPNTVITLTPAQKQNLAIGHNETGVAVENWDMPAIAGTGALRSNINDMLNFAGDRSVPRYAIVAYSPHFKET